MSTISGSVVVDRIMAAKTAGTKAAATRLRQKFIRQQEATGKDPVWVDRGIKALLTRRQNGN
jgi:hypothetical protein